MCAHMGREQLQSAFGAGISDGVLSMPADPNVRRESGLNEGHDRSGSVKDQDKVRIFISYSRKDRQFAERLVVALEQRGLEARIDNRDLPTLEDWRRELLGFISTADAVVFVISPNSTKSAVCAWEIEQVADQNKRLAPVVIERVADDAIPATAAKINYLYFDHPNDFEAQADKLANALQTDLTWIKEHTRLGALSARWRDRSMTDARGADDLMLRGAELADAELWISRRPREAPEPTDLHRRFIQASRKAEQARANAEALRARRRAYIATTISIVLAVATVAIFLLYINSNYNLMLAHLTKADRLLIEEKPTQALVVAGSMTKPSRFDLQLQFVNKFLPTSSEEATRIQTLAYLAGLGSSVPLRTFKAVNSAGAVAFGGDGDRFAVGFRSGKVMIGRARDGSAPFVLDLQTKQIKSLQFSPDGRLLASATAQTIVVLDVAGRRIVTSLCVAENGVYGIAFAPDGRYLAAVSDDGQLTIWETANWTKIQSIKEHSGWALAVDFSADGRLIATSGDDGTLVVRKTADWSIDKTIATGRPDLISVSFSSDGKRLATASIAGPIDVWNLELQRPTGASLAIPGPSDRRWKVRYSPDGKLLAVASWGGTVRLFDASTLTYSGSIDGNDHWINDIAFSKDSSLLITASESGAVRIWKLADVHAIFYTVLDDSRETLVGRYSPDGKSFASGGRDGYARLYHVDADGRLAFACAVRHEDWVNTLAFSPDSRSVVSAGTSARKENNTVRIWDAATCRSVRELSIGRRMVRSVSFSHDGGSVAWSTDSGEVWLADVSKRDNGELLIRLQNPGGRELAFSPDGKLLAVGSINGGLEIWDLKTRTLSRRIAGHVQSVLSVKFSPDGKLLASGGPDEFIIIWDLTRPKGEEKLRQLVVRGGTNELAFSRDGQRLSAGSDGRYVAMWSATTWEKNFQLNALVGVRSVFDFHPTRGDLAFDGENGTIRILLRRADPGVAFGDVDAKLRGIDAVFDPAASDVDETRASGTRIDARTACQQLGLKVR